MDVLNWNIAITYLATIMDNLSRSLVITSLAAVSAIASAIATWKSYQIAKVLSKICNIFTTPDRDEITIVATSETERVFVLDISIIIKLGFFKRSTYSLSRSKNVQLFHEKSKILIVFSRHYLKGGW